MEASINGVTADGQLAENRRCWADTPLLVLVHGTGPQPHDGMEVFGDGLTFDCTEAPHPDETGDLWWQSDGMFFRRLTARITTRDGRSLIDPGMIVRLKWPGHNSEHARDAAAHAFTELFRSCAPRQLHVIAHSHGGNVVRTGIERLARKRSDLTRIGAVISMGTPFFTYSKRQALTLGLVKAIAAVAAIAAAYFLLDSLPGRLGSPLLGGPARSVLHTPYWAYGLIGLATSCGLWALILLLQADELIRRRPRGQTLPRKLRVEWTNLCSHSDEAIQLLRSLDRRVELFTGASRSWGQGLTWYAIAFGFLVIPITPYVMYIQSRDWNLVQIILAQFVCVLMVPLLYAVLKRTRDAVASAVSVLLDHLVTRRLRRLAFGDTFSVGIAGVSTVPWIDHPHAHRALPEVVEKAIEAHIETFTGNLWARARQAIRPDAPLRDADFQYLVEELLSGDELIHTVYYRVESFVDLVADLLVSTGDYVRRSSKLAGGASQ